MHSFAIKQWKRNLESGIENATGPIIPIYAPVFKVFIFTFVSRWPAFIPKKAILQKFEVFNLGFYRQKVPVQFKHFKLQSSVNTISIHIIFSRRKSKDKV